MNHIVEQIKLTQYSHGAGCGCKISPAILDSILGHVAKDTTKYSSLLVGNAQRDDAAVMDLGDGTAIISTTDFFMPIVDDPETFGRIAATNAISDIYAMGGTPLMAVAILGWPVSVLNPEIAGRVVNGAQLTCIEAGIPLAGGHSIDSPEPIFGLAVTGRVDIRNIKKNGGAKPGDLIFLTKPLGIGILTTAEKKGIINVGDAEKAVRVMTRLNKVGKQLGKITGVSAMTDVTGFGLAGHLLEMCQASETSAVIYYNDLPVIDKSVHFYISQGCIPGGTNRNYDSYGIKLTLVTDEQRFIMCDPQTSGGLLIAVSPDSKSEVQDLLKAEGLWFEPIGKMEDLKDKTIRVC
ncbi:MAG: selenide, water dikinase SelD [Saprospiraceae bacterium]|uniref:Selenide, water dikinase n=1 Tax=Candidatus Opimibacter skivensis TaxID=2982028 RepID=A0A9D7STA7_9BACT|nr:selenide, water dikinase SelD [Candidatus Opimibacter skivensis]